MTGFDDVTFDHFFGSSPGILEKTPSSDATIVSGQASGADEVKESSNQRRWLGWSWTPPADAFGQQPPSAFSSPNLLTLPTSFVTPARHSRAIATSRDLSPPYSMPKSVARTRPLSQRRAFAELKRCVYLSARKRAAAYGRLPSPLLRLPDRPNGLDAPPTPTPRSRDASESDSRSQSLLPMSSIGGADVRAHGENQRYTGDLQDWHRSIEIGYEVSDRSRIGEKWLISLRQDLERRLGSLMRCQ